MISPKISYTNVDTGDTAYPEGKAQNVSAPAAGDGTPGDKDWLNDWWGFQQAVLKAVSALPTGTPDTADASQLLDILEVLHGGPGLIYKQATETRTTTTYAADAEFNNALPVAAGKRYELCGRLILQAENVSDFGGFKMQLTGVEGTISYIASQSSPFNPAAPPVYKTTASSAVNPELDLEATALNITPANGGNRIIEVSGSLIFNSGTTLGVSWALDTSAGAATRLLDGSFLGLRQAR